MADLIMYNNTWVLLEYIRRGAPILHAYRYLRGGW